MLLRSFKCSLCDCVVTNLSQSYLQAVVSVLKRCVNEWMCLTVCGVWKCLIESDPSVDGFSLSVCM